MSSASSAAEMIRRFREGPPISREDRAAAVADGNAPPNMWWSTANKRGGEDNDISLRKDSHSHINVKADPLEHSEGSEPRIGSTLQRPEPAASRSISPMSRIAKYEALNPHKKPTDYMSQSAARSFGRRETLEVDAMIESEIRELQQQTKADMRAQVGDSMEFTSGYGYGASRTHGGGGGATLRDSLRSSFGGFGGSLRNSIEGLDNAHHTRGGGAGGVGASTDTLGSTGIRALLMPELRLDGKKDTKDDLDAFLGKYNIELHNEGSSAQSAEGAHGGNIGEVGDSALKGINDNMDDLMNRLTGGNAGNASARQSGSFFSSSSPVSASHGGVSLVANSIPDITAFLGSEMHAFEQAAQERESGFAVSAKEQRERDNRVREEGRAEARALGLFGINHVLVKPGVTPAGKVAASNPNAPPTMMDELLAMNAFLGPETHAVAPAAAVHSIDRFASAGSSGGAFRSKASGSELVPVQQAIDNEMVAADEVLYRMRALRTGLGQRLRRLDALHAEVMCDKDSGIYVPPAAAAAISPAAINAMSGRPPLPPSPTPTVPASARAGGSPPPYSAFGTGADVAPPVMPEKMRVLMNTEMADKVAHAAQNIASALTITMEGMVNRLSDNHLAEASREPAMSGAVPAVSGSFPAPAPAPAPASVQRHESSQAASTAAAAAAAAAPGTSAPAVSNPNTFGETQAQLREPTPEKSLFAQLEEMDSALGAESGPGAPVGIDKFLPHSLRVQNALITNAVQTSPAQGKSRAPSPFRTGHSASAPTLYTVHVPSSSAPASPASASSSSSSAAQGGSRYISAPSDEELWLRSLQERGQLRAPPSAPTAPSLIARLPAEPLPAAKDGQGQSRKLPWQTSGSDASTLRRRPVEGAALLYDRSHNVDAAAGHRAELQQQRVDFLAAQAPTTRVPYSSYAQNAAPNPSPNGAYGDAREGGDASRPPPALVKASQINDRQEYLRKMQAIRQGMSLTAF